MNSPPNTGGVVTILFVSAAGHVIHNLVEFPASILLGWETTLPVAITALLGVVWYTWRERAAYALVAGWAAIVLVFGGGSVLPLGVLPFVPEQSVSHYVAHLVYTGTQLPLLWVGIREFRSSKNESKRQPV